MPRLKLVTDETVWRAIGELGRRTSGGPHAAEEVADQIQQLIISEEIAEGTRLPSERDLAQILGTSRPTVSQAIRILVTRGLVESRRGSGAYVTPRPEMSMAASVNLMLKLNGESVPQFNELRLSLETTGVLLAIERRSDDDIAEGEAALRELSLSVGNTAAWLSADTHFHATLIRASRNPFLASIYESVHATLLNYEYRAWISTGALPGWLQKSEAGPLTALHAAILDGVRAGNPDAAKRAIQRHHEVMADHLRRARKTGPGTRQAG